MNAELAPSTPETDKVNILLVDDQPARLLSYESILGELGPEPGQGAFGHRGAASG